MTPGVVYGESVVRMAGGDKRRSWGENQSRVIFATGKKQASMMPSQDNQQGGKKAEELIQLRKDLEELRRRKQELREQFGENEKVLAEVEGWLATVGRQCEIARLIREITKNGNHFSRSPKKIILVLVTLCPQVQRGGGRRGKTDRPTPLPGWKVTNHLHPLSNIFWWPVIEILRLARVEEETNEASISGMPTKRERLQEQLEEARGLEAFVEQRVRRVERCLRGYQGMEEAGERFKVALEERRGLVVATKEVEERLRTIQEAAGIF